MITAAIFDMDGLMIDSNPIISKAYGAVLREYGAEPRLNKQGFIHTPGISSRDNWRKILKSHNLNLDISELVKKKSRLHTQLIKDGVDPMPGLYDLLGMLKKHNIKMSIASSSKREVIESVLRNLKITQYFETIVSGDDVENGKPSPDIFLVAAKRLGELPENCVVFEDAIDGVRAAKAANMKCIAVPTEMNLSNSEFEVADLICRSLELVSWEEINKLNN